MGSSTLWKTIKRPFVCAASCGVAILSFLLADIPYDRWNYHQEINSNVSGGKNAALQKFHNETKDKPWVTNAEKCRDHYSWWNPWQFWNRRQCAALESRTGETCMHEDDTTYNCQARYKGKSLGSGLRLEDAKHATGDFAAYRDLAAAYEKSSAARTLAVKKVRASSGVGGPLGKLVELTRPKADKKTTQQDNEYNRSVLRKHS